MTVAEMLGELKARGLSYVHIGAKLQVSAITVRRWAHGDFDPRYQQGKALEGLHQSVTQVCLDSGGQQAQKAQNEIEPDQTK